MLRRILMFDVNRILTWDVGRALKADVFTMRIGRLLLYAAAGWMIVGTILAIALPYIVRRGWEIPGGALLLVMVAGVTTTVLLGRRSRRE